MIFTCAAILAASGFDFYANGPYSGIVPKPESILGYGPGDRHTTFREQELVLQGIVAGAGKRAKLIDYGRSNAGRPLRVVAISSPKNIAKLDQIKADMATLAHAGPDVDTAAIRARTPTIVWINECIHGNETASFESAMWLVYNLAASNGSKISTALENAVVIVNPVYNPDGHERYVVYYNSVATGSSAAGSFEAFEPGVVYGRLNQYRFDMNRDRVSMSQIESQQEVAEFLRWNPQVYADQHGQVETYFFPPNPMSVNINVDWARINKWTTTFGQACGEAFDRNGFLYYVKDVFDLYYPGYLDSWTCLSGAIGMTHETDGGHQLARERSDGTILTLRRGIEKHFTSALAVIESAASHRAELLADYAKFKSEAVSGKSAGKFQRVLLAGDFRALQRVQDQLALHGISSAFAKPGFSQVATDYWTPSSGPVSFPDGALVVDMAQSQGPLAKSLLEPGAEFEAKFIEAQSGKKKTAPEGEKYPGPEGAEFYDFTGWAIPYAHGLRAWWSTSTPHVDSVPSLGSPYVSPTLSTIGYALPYSDENDILAVFDALSRGIHVSMTTKPMTLGGVKHSGGTFLFLAERNDDALRFNLDQIAKSRPVQFQSLTTTFPLDDRYSPGGESVAVLHKPRIGIVFGNQANLASVGSIWYLMDKVFHLPFTPLSQDSLNNINLSSYTCIVVPGRATAPTSGKFKDWVSAGGCVIALDNPNWAEGPTGYVDLPELTGEFQSLPGSLFRAEIDPRSFLAFGYKPNKKGKIEIAVPVTGNSFWKIRKEGGSVVHFADDEKTLKLLSGWEWPNETEKTLNGVLWLQDAPVGRGRAILFTQDPTERAMWPGLYRILLNAMLLGPA